MSGILNESTNMPAIYTCCDDKWTVYYNAPSVPSIPPNPVVHHRHRPRFGQGGQEKQIRRDFTNRAHVTNDLGSDFQGNINIKNIKTLEKNPIPLP